jgi:SAM-dependent methyltransferase
VESDGVVRGLDVFGGFLRDGRLYLMGEVGAPFRREWVWPLTTVTLEGRSFPAPARPERLLEAMYGPGWRTPDPAFKFETPRGTVRRLDGWFRGTRGGRDLVWGVPSRRRLRVRPVRPSAFARWVRSCEGPIGTFVDVGCGAGTDAFWMARRGTPAVGVDFKPSHYRTMAARAASDQLPLSFAWANLNELRSVLVTGAELARRPGPRVMTARHLADALDATGLENLLRLARMVVGGSGRLHLQVLRAPVAQPAAPDPRQLSRAAGTEPVDVDSLVEQITRHGGRVESRHDLVESAADGPHGTEPSEEKREVTRMVVSWQR